MNDPTRVSRPDSSDRVGQTDSSEPPTVPVRRSTAGEVPAQRPGPPRLRPRPLHRPAVDPAAAAVFSRPNGVGGGFAGRVAPSGAGSIASRTSPITGSARTDPPSPALIGAFGRPAAGGPALQRPPGVNGSAAAGADPLWAARRDPWRDPDAVASLGAPATADEPAVAAPTATAARLSLREVLFGRRVRARALAALGGLALLVGAAGGVVVWLVAAGTDDLRTADPTIVQSVQARERPPGSVADLAQRTLPAVVSIEIRVGQEGGTGSGVVIDPAGYVLTNNHVIAPAAESTDGEIEVVFSDGSRSGGRIVGRDPKTDLAVLQVGVANPVVATVGSSADLAVGDGVIAIGSPYGLAGTVTDGIVSAVDRPVRLDAEGSPDAAVIDAIQTDAAINPGNSGGPLIDSTGAVVGINTAIRSVGAGEGGSIGLGFAIPIDDARAIAEELITTGVVRHADIGINSRSVTDGTTDGAQVQNVTQGGAAAAAGVVEGDVVVRLGERSIAGADELIVAVRERQPGETVTLELVRDGRPLTVSVVLSSD